MNAINWFFLIFSILSFSACTIVRPVSEDYGQYLENNQSNSLPKTKLKTDYQIDSQTMNHRYEFRATSAGRANLWVVEFGKMLNDTLSSKDMQAAFGRLTKRVSGSASGGYLTSFSLKNYEYKNFHAYVSLNISVKNASNKEIFNKTYTSEGRSQGGKTIWGGAFAMKNAVQQSTKSALDDILSSFIGDVNAKARKRK